MPRTHTPNLPTVRLGNDPLELLTVREVAARTGKHPETIKRWIRDGHLLAVRLGPRDLRVRASDLAAAVKPR
ncbi:helix-turn-helix domain-containing protein [Agromyces salentinus]|uniref:Helix-turn-helix domain-containing protein n=1 Tax=Agromyces salentinus TaxID=269421 RepID=A0ABN2MNH1_9MICO|nr:helix-turn-helix domain-containing protein [Agromyces salentinus]